MTTAARTKLLLVSVGVLAVTGAAALVYLHDIAAVVACVVVAAALIAFATWTSNRNLERLADEARGVSRGDARRVSFDAGGALGDLGGAVNDLAAGAERAVAALTAERGVLGSVLGSLSHGVVVLDADRRITVINAAARDLLELDEGAVGNDLLGRVRVPALLALVNEAPGGPIDVDLPGGAKVSARSAPLADVPGGGVLLVLDDVTAVRRLETVRKDFVANVSHELRTPVSIIRANAETLLGGAIDDPRFAHKLVDGLHRNAERLARILTDLLDLSRLDATQYRIELAPVELAAAAAQAADSVEPEAAEKQIAIAVDVPAELSAAADAKALDQVLVNLLDNAVKYTPAGGHVRIEGRAVDGGVRLEVADDGPGIAPKHKQRIFERFYRVDPGRSREMGGTGLGLSIVKHLVESLGGTIGVTDNTPRGARFWIELRAAGDLPPAAPRASTPAPE